MLVLSFATPASANTACVADNLSSILGTSCDIGPLRFTFTSLFSEFNITNNATGQVFDDVKFPASDFYLAPTEKGFNFTFLNGPQLMTESQGYHAGEDVFLFYNLSILDPSLDVIGQSVSSPGISATGSSYSNVSIVGWTTAVYWSQIYGGSVVNDVAGTTSTYPFVYGDGANNPLSPGSPPYTGVTGVIMGADNGNLAYWSGSINASFTTAPVPEPSSLLILSVGLLGLAALSFLRRT